MSNNTKASYPGGNNAEASGSASIQAQQEEPVVQVLVLEVNVHPMLDGQREEYK
ncbi:hypothetical protein Tco_1381667, partial [Tanacetum coccineum]